MKILKHKNYIEIGVKISYYYLAVVTKVREKRHFIDNTKRKDGNKNNGICKLIFPLSVFAGKPDTLFFYQEQSFQECGTHLFLAFLLCMG